ncbi:hypothetical protein [Cupriavidus pauculus]|uniref:hypothetical protein n=1 Tax=Cupriavidus pauculus TaxID=82633 RepID=UPI001EE39EA1|nr:hypothetical protein [Cupriavidus pauculus]GJG97609.1 hypothetical protein CBA19C6_23990 [Cupriavidus pauculus]
MDAKALVLLAFHVAILGTVFSYGLQATRADLAYLFHRPGLLCRSLLATAVIVPVVVVVCVKSLNLPHAAAVVLTVLSISPVPPMLPKKQSKAGGMAPYALALLVVLGLSSVVTVPLWGVLLESVFDLSLSMRPGAILKIVLTMIVAPLLAGLLVSTLLPGLARRLAQPVRKVATCLLIAGAVVILAGTWRAILAATGHWVVVAIIAFVLLGLVVGHLLGGPEREHSPVLALSSTARHPAIALTIASANFPDEQFIPTLALYLIVCTLVVIPYVKWQRAQAAGDPQVN